MRECFVTSEVVDHFHLLRLARIGGFQCRKKLIHRNVNLDNVQLLPNRRTESTLVRRSRAGDKNVVRPDLPSQPELGRAGKAAGDQWLEGRCDDVVMDRSWK